MSSTAFRLLLLIVIVAMVTCELDRCTTIVVGAKAGKDGPMATHTADCSDCDFRLNKVPRKFWDNGVKRPLFQYKGNYPAMVTEDRGETWKRSNLEGTPEQIALWSDGDLPITGYISQVSETFALYEAGYAIMNEFQVAMGESTCAGAFWTKPTTAGGKAQIEIRQMSQIALERSITAVQAIQTMGFLATTYGFYGAAWNCEGGVDDDCLGEAGETLTVIDKTDAWVFHVLPDDTGTSAVWVAQRVPEDNVAAIANQFIIRDVPPNSADFMHSENMWEVAQRNGLWKPSMGLLDFTKTFARTRAHPPYANRRRWRVLTLANRELELSPYTNNTADDYPFSVKADRKLTAQDLMQFQRDHYEGTEFDMTQGLASGPYGDPNRFDPAPQPADGLTFSDIVQGAYERSISMFRTSYSTVAVSRRHVPDQLALIWFTQHAPSSSSYSPLYVDSSLVPAPLMRGSLFKYDSDVAFWNFCAVGNYAARFYRYAMKDVVALQQQLQESTLQAVADIEVRAMELLKQSQWHSYNVNLELTELTNQQSLGINDAWKSLLPQLITKYHDGYVVEHLNTTAIQMTKIFYPKYWLDATGYWLNKRNNAPGVLEFIPTPDSDSSKTTARIVLFSFIFGMMGLMVGILIGQRAAKVSNSGLSLFGRPRDYIPIDL